MTRKERIHNWLITGLKQPANRLSELFYYDKRDNEFFSILITDYFLFDEKWNIPKGTTTTYTKQNIKSLRDRMCRIETNDRTIISLERLGNISEEDDFITQQADNFLRQNNINPETATIWEIESTGSITVNIKESYAKPWWKFWK